MGRGVRSSFPESEGSSYFTSHAPKPVPSEDLFPYMVVSSSAANSALIREELGAQHPVFYTSNALLEAETHYPKLEMLSLKQRLLVNKSKESSRADKTSSTEPDQLRDIVVEGISTFTIQQVPRAENAHADVLASIGSVLDTQF
ncbi:unnamed protein product [Prunus brigantina]